MANEPSDNEWPLHVTGALNVSGETSHGKLTEELAKFFIAAWDAYEDNPSADMEWVLQETELLEQRETTQEEVDALVSPEDCEVGDTYYALSPLGKQAWEIVKAASDRRKAELGVVKPQSTSQEDTW